MLHEMWVLKIVTKRVWPCVAQNSKRNTRCGSFGAFKAAGCRRKVNVRSAAKPSTARSGQPRGEATRHYSSSLTRVLQPRGRDRGLPSLAKTARYPLKAGPLRIPHSDGSAHCQESTRPLASGVVICQESCTLPPPDAGRQRKRRQ